MDAVVVVGTNLPMARVAGMAEFWLGKPVIALKTAPYWHALRENGIDDKVQGFGRLLAEFDHGRANDGAAGPSGTASANALAE